MNHWIFLMKKTNMKKIMIKKALTCPEDSNKKSWCENYRKQNTVIPLISTNQVPLTGSTKHMTTKLMERQKVAQASQDHLCTKVHLLLCTCQTRGMMKLLWKLENLEKRSKVQILRTDLGRIKLLLLAQLEEMSLALTQHRPSSLRNQRELLHLKVRMFHRINGHMKITTEGQKSKH